ncbi:3-phosphoshikimate 1-carboxyvinyltransferase [Madurella mycetomatis]|uniref:3-phosphoshikimate 1-carboxyvinyltransferase n=1 Tax=Madurella mycetomatis TaxID=100816 RepID=A0A175W4D1_9PEZI|nr:3-phosphoshikimate 1-carboxyvinyltransferase [Madurella mycetomatis]
MPIFSKPDAASSFPVDSTTPFRLIKAFYVNEGTEFSLTFTMTDVTTALEPLLSPFILVETPPSLLEAAKSAAASAATPTLQFKRPNRLSRTWTALDPVSGHVVAESSNPLWSLGKWTIKFPPLNPASISPHSEHDIILHPAGVAARADEFVKDSVPCFWDMLDGRRLCKLYRASDGKKVETARFVGASVRGREGVLLIGEDDQGERRADEVVVMVTLVAVLNRSDSFRA